jgi:hypothetical protein
MKRIIFIIFGGLFIVIGFFVLGYSKFYEYQNQRGGYEPITGKIWCEDTFTCNHEKGHALDKKWGWISKSSSWKQAVDQYRKTEWELSPEQRDTMAAMIEFFPGLGSSYEEDWSVFSNTFSGWTKGWGGYTELYATIYGYAHGNVKEIPVSLRMFYEDQTVVLGKR